MMPAWFRWALTLFAVVALSLGIGANVDRCSRPGVRPLPLRAGDCRPAEFTREMVTAYRCEHGGETWHCIVRENRCALVGPVEVP